MSQPQGNAALDQIQVDEFYGRLSKRQAAQARAALTADSERAELVAGLRAIADWYEQHTEIAPPTFPDFTVSVGQSGEWTQDDGEGRARMDAFAAALDAQLCIGDHLDAERKFGSVKLRAYFITSAARRSS